MDVIPDTSGDVIIQKGLCWQVEGHVLRDKLAVSFRDLNIGIELGSIIQDLVSVCLLDYGRDVAPSEVCLTEALYSQLDHASH